MIKILLPTLDRFFFTGNMKALMGLEVSSNFVFNQKFIKNNEFFYSGLGAILLYEFISPSLTQSVTQSLTQYFSQGHKRVFVVNNTDLH